MSGSVLIVVLAVALIGTEIGVAATEWLMGHTLKGTAGGYGFDGLSAIGASIENAAKSSDPTAIAQCADEMETYLNTVQVVYR